MTATATQRFTEANRVDQGLPPVSRGANTYDTSYYSLRDYHKATVLVSVGAVAATGTLDVSILQAKDATGSGAKALSPAKALTQIVDGDDNQIFVIEIDSAELDEDGRFDHILVRTIVATDAVLYDVTVIRHQPRFGPVGVSQLGEVVT